MIREDNVHRLKTRLVLEGTNIPVSPAAERILHGRGVWVVPDFIANAGGVICAALEYRGATQAGVFAAIEERIAANTAEVLSAARRDGIAPRVAALARAMGMRRFGIC